MAKTRAYGADCVLLAAFETAYGTPPANGYTRLSFKDSIRAQEQMARGQDMLAEALKRGSVTTDEHGRFLKLLKDRCAEAGGAVTAMGNAHGMATWQIQAVSHSVRASAEMLMAGASPVRTFAMEGMRLTSVFGAGSLAVMGWGVAVAALVTTSHASARTAPGLAARRAALPDRSVICGCLTAPAKPSSLPARAAVRRWVCCAATIRILKTSSRSNATTHVSRCSTSRSLSQTNS